MQAIGKFIDSSGIPKIMVDSGLIADGSLKGLLQGTHFNRCKKIHPVAALSIKIQHFKTFLRVYEKRTDESNLHMSEMIEILERDSDTNIETTLFEMKDLLNEYSAYTKDTLNGKHGYTAKFALLYIWLIELYQMLERAVRTSDLNLYIYAAYNMCSVFFVVNHQNYARWLTRNLDELINIETTHPGLKDDFECGAMSIRRTKKNFCRTPIDLTLEQTINANAANKLRGISAFTNSLSARQKWSETHAIRTAVITELLEFLGLSKSNDINDNAYHSKQFKKQLAQFSEELKILTHSAKS